MFKNLDDNADIGYLVEVDLEYPNHIKEYTKNFPFTPIKRTVKYEELSDYQHFLIKDIKRIPQEKLICDQYDKTEYVCHYRNLKFYLEKGMILKKVHNMLQFSQSPWLKTYFDFNTLQRSKKGIPKCEKDFFKLMNNAFYVKTIENIRYYQDIKLVNNNDKRVIKLQSKPDFVNTVAFSGSVKAIHCKIK